LAAKQALPSI